MHTLSLQEKDTQFQEIQTVKGGSLSKLQGNHYDQGHSAPRGRSMPPGRSGFSGLDASGIITCQHWWSANMAAAKCSEKEKMCSTRQDPHVNRDENQNRAGEAGILHLCSSIYSELCYFLHNCKRNVGLPRTLGRWKLLEEGYVHQYKCSPHHIPAPMEPILYRAWMENKHNLCKKKKKKKSIKSP